MNIDQNMYEKIILWTKNILGSNSLNSVVTVVKTPWSTVLKISTVQETIYLKQTPQALFVEVDVIQVCRDLCGITEIPEIIATDKHLHCFLMKECGKLTLRAVLDGHLNVDLLTQGLQSYTKMQKSTIPHVEAFIKVGVPDWRLEHFPKLYESLVKNKGFLKSYGLDMDQMIILENAIFKVESVSQALSKYKIPECLNHSDFHDNNMIFCNASKKICIIDLGEMAINHPFFSRAAFLKAICERYKLEFSSKDYHTLYAACFHEWVKDKESIKRIFELINLLLPVYLLFAQKRFLDVINLPYEANNPLSVKQHEKINKGFIWFINNMESYDGS